jgi:hypothetical protein
VRRADEGRFELARQPYVGQIPSAARQQPQIFPPKLGRSDRAPR